MATGFRQCVFASGYNRGYNLFAGSNGSGQCTNPCRQEAAHDIASVELASVVGSAATAQRVRQYSAQEPAKTSDGFCARRAGSSPHPPPKKRFCGVRKRCAWGPFSGTDKAPFRAALPRAAGADSPVAGQHSRRAASGASAGRQRGHGKRGGAGCGAYIARAWVKRGQSMRSGDGAVRVIRDRSTGCAAAVAGGSTASVRCLGSILNRTGARVAIAALVNCSPSSL